MSGLIYVSRAACLLQAVPSPTKNKLFRDRPCGPNQVSSLSGFAPLLYISFLSPTMVPCVIPPPYCSIYDLVAFQRQIYYVHKQSSVCIILLYVSQVITILCYFLVYSGVPGTPYALQAVYAGHPLPSTLRFDPALNHLLGSHNFISVFGLPYNLFNKFSLSSNNTPPARSVHGSFSNTAAPNFCQPYVLYLHNGF